MRSSLLLFGATAVAFTIPAGQPNGVYSVKTDNNGNEVHTFLHDLLENNLQARDNRHINRRQVSGTDLVGCGNYAMNHGDTDAAFNNIIAQCGGGTSVGKGLDFYSVSGCVVAYFCNLSSSNVQCKLRTLTLQS